MRHRQESVNGIPISIVDDHNESYRDWQEAGIQSATLLHVDAHSDMMADSCAPMSEVPLSNPLNYYKSLGISDFLSAAVHNGIVSSLYWLNPHSPQRYLQDMGTVHENESRLPLKTRVRDNRIAWDIGARAPSNGQIIRPEDIQFEDPFILGIDLDAFCCNKNIRFVDAAYSGVDHFEDRIDTTIELLRGTSTRPTLITIARSVSSEAESTFMPPDMVAAVQEYLLGKLRQLYAASEG